jgi:hypothetical protein
MPSLGPIEAIPALSYELVAIAVLTSDATTE